MEYIYVYICLLYYFIVLYIFLGTPTTWREDRDQI